MKGLVLGANGMLGSALVEELAPKYAITCTVRGSQLRDMPAGVELLPGVDVADGDVVDRLVSSAKPDFIVNCIGMVKQRSQEFSREAMIAANALFPHRLARAARRNNSHLVHISTDCVFSGKMGRYTEAGTPDPVDDYGMTKFLGEPEGEGVTVIRCSMIGLEIPSALKAPHGLIEWFLAQSGEVPGYRNAIFSGLTTRSLSRVIDSIVREGGPFGLWHVAAEPVSKYLLLSELARRLPDAGVKLVPVDVPVIDRSLDASAFCSRTGCAVPSWNFMLDELADDIRQRARDEMQPSR